jgi:hypothetical protein
MDGQGRGEVVANSVTGPGDHGVLAAAAGGQRATGQRPAARHRGVACTQRPQAHWAKTWLGGAAHGSSGAPQPA